MTRKHCDFRSGYTLVELSIVIIIISLLTASGLAMGASMVERAGYVDTEKQLEQLEQSLQDYYTVYGRLPCVARTDLLPDDADFGTEVEDCLSATAPTGTWNNSNTWVGMIPVRTLGLPDSAASDKFGSRILYAVTEEMTDSSSFGGATGTISIYGIDDSTPIQTNMAYALYSHGRDRKGAYTYSTGAVATPCGTSDNLDVMNCTFTDAHHYRDAPFNSGDQEDYFFDDLIHWAPKYHFMALDTNSSSLWTKHPTNDNIYSVGADAAQNPADTFVGIGTDDPEGRLEIKQDGGNSLLLSGTNGGDRYIRFLEDTLGGSNLYKGGFLRYDNTNNNLILGVHDAADSSLLSDIDALTIKRSDGNIGIGTTTPTEGKLHVEGGPIYAGQMWLGESGDTLVAPDIQMDHSGLIAVGDSLALAIDAAGDAGATRAIHFYKNGLNMSSGTQFGMLTENSSLYLGLDGGSTFFSGSSATNQRFVLEAAQSYNDGGALFMYGRTHPDYAGQMHYYSAQPSSGTIAHAFRRRWGGTSYPLLSLYADADGYMPGTLNHDSDKRLKKDIKPIEGALEKLQSIDGIYFRWNGKGGHIDTKSVQLSVIAQDVQKVFPDLVEMGENDYLTVNIDGLTPVLIEAVHELDEKNMALENRVNNLEARLTELENTAPISHAPASEKNEHDYARIVIIALLGIILILLLRGKKRA